MSSAPPLRLPHPHPPRPLIIWSNDSAPLLPIAPSLLDDPNGESYNLELHVFRDQPLPSRLIYQFIAAALESVALQWHSSPPEWTLPVDAAYGLQLTVRSNFDFRVQLKEYTYLLDTMAQVMAKAGTFAPCTGTLWHQDIVPIAKIELRLLNAIEGTHPAGLDTDSGVLVARTPPASPDEAQAYRPANISFRPGASFTLAESVLMLTLLTALRKSVNAAVIGWPTFTFRLDVAHIDMVIRPVPPYEEVERLDAIRTIVMGMEREYEETASPGEWKELTFVVGKEGIGVAEGALTFLNK